MNVLIVSTWDTQGGAARAAYRLHQGLRALGIPSHMLVQRKRGTDASVHGPETMIQRGVAALRPLVEEIPLRLYRSRERVPYHAQWLPERLPKRVARLNPDVVHLQWICGGFVRIETLAKLGRPIVWTMHDMWPFTGGCHHSRQCTRYRGSCGACPQLGSTRQYDLSLWGWRRKARALRELDITVVCPSRWLAECAQSSSLFRDRRIEVIPNGIDVQVFKPVDQAAVRDLLNMPQHVPLVLFGAINATGNPFKGFHHLAGALNILRKQSERPDMQVVIFGASGSSEDLGLGFSTHVLGKVQDDTSLVALYNAADVFVLPSSEDNLPNTVMEAMACGVPCVAFDIGGLWDMIDHKVNGYLARPFDEEDLAEGILWVLEDKERHAQLAQRARAKVEREFTLEVVARRYMALYEEVLGESHGGPDACEGT